MTSLFSVISKSFQSMTDKNQVPCIIYVCINLDQWLSTVCHSHWLCL